MSCQPVVHAFPFMSCQLVAFLYNMSCQLTALCYMSCKGRRNSFALNCAISFSKFNIFLEILISMLLGSYWNSTGHLMPVKVFDHYMCSSVEGLDSKIRTHTFCLKLLWPFRANMPALKACTNSLCQTWNKFKIHVCTWGSQKHFKQTENTVCSLINEFGKLLKTLTN